MIQLFSADLKRFHALARLFLTGIPRRLWPSVRVVGHEAGVIYTLPSAAGFLQYHVVGLQAPTSVVVPWNLWTQLLATKSPHFRVAAAGDSTILAQWQEGDVPRQTRCELPSGHQELAAPPARSYDWRDIDVRFLGDLQACCEVTDRESSRFALGCVQFDRQGRMTASDGQQILIYHGWNLDVSEPKLLPANPILTSKEWTTARTLQAATTDADFALRAGPWTVSLKWQTEGRFPRIDDILADASAATTRLELERQDREFLAKNLSRLPARDDSGAKAITLELNGRVAIRASDGNSPPTELVLTRSRRVGPEVRLATDRKFLARALQLGFTQLDIADDARPMGCRDERHQYVWALLSPDAREAASAESLVIESDRSPTALTEDAALSSAEPEASEGKFQASEPQSPSIVANTIVDDTRHAKTSSPEPSALSALEHGLELRRLTRELARQSQRLVRELRSQQRQLRQARRRTHSRRRKASLV